MKRKGVLPISIIAGFLLLAVIGIGIFIVKNCSGIYVRTSGGGDMGDEGFPDWGLTLSVRDVTPTGLTLVCTQEGGNPTGDLQCGEDYRLIVLENGTWKDVPTVLGNFIWDSLAYPIAKGQDREFEISWEWLYGKLPAGTYRLTKEFMDFRETADFDTANYWVEFEIEE